MRRVIAWVPLALVVAVVLAGCGAGDDPAGATPVESANPAASLQLGDCVRLVQAIDLAGAEQRSSLETADCEKPHHGEVVLAQDDFFADSDQLPGEDQIVARSEAACSQAMYDYTGFKPEQTPYRMSYTYPTEKSWAGGDRKLTCIAVAYDTGFDSVVEVAGSIRSTG